MKKKYIAPAAEVVNVHLISSVLNDELPFGGDSIVGTGMDAKENTAGVEEDEGLINPTQPNLWGDEED